MEKEQEAIVLDVIGQTARVRASRHNDCEHCGACPGNSALVFDAINTVGARPGQRVAVQVQEVNMLKAAFIVYMLPLVSAAGGAVLGGLLADKLIVTPLWLQLGGGALAFCIAILYIRYFERSARSDAKMQPIVTRIISG